MATSSALMATTSKDFSAFHYLFIFTGTFTGYYLANLHPEINFTNTKFKINENKIILTIAFIFLLILLVMSSFPFFKLVQYGLASLLSFCYYTQFTSKNGSFFGTRSVYLLKNFSIALAWAFVTSPILLVNSDSILLFLQRFLFLFALSISIDLRDIKKDSRRKIVTFPIQHGHHTIVAFCSVSLFLYLSSVFKFTPYRIHYQRNT